MILAEPIAYKMPFASGVQEKIESLEAWHSAELRCAECGEAYFVLIPDSAPHPVKVYLADLRKDLAACGRHPPVVRWG